MGKWALDKRKETSERGQQRLYNTDSDIIDECIDHNEAHYCIILNTHRKLRMCGEWPIEVTYCDGLNEKGSP